MKIITYGSGHKTLKKVLSITLSLLVLVQMTPAAFIIHEAQAATSATLQTVANGTYTAWGGDESDVDETSNFSCSGSDYISEGTTGDRESFTLSLASIPNGSTITSVSVSVRDRGDSSSGGTYQTFVRLNSSDTNSGVDLAATGGSGDGCSNVKTQNITVADTVKSGATTLEVGVIKTATNTNTVRVGTITATVTYTEVPPTPNPDLDGACGLDIALVMDSSGSINQNNPTNLATMQDAFKGFVNTFLPGTPTEFAVVDFDATATTLQGFTSDITDIETAIDTPTSGGSTNWEDALLEARGLFPNRGGNPDLIVFASDGNPTVNNGSSATSGTTDGNDLTNAILQASLAKGEDIRIVTLGIGGNVSQANLEAISSADAYYSTANFDDLAETLDEIVTELCGGTINITKVIDEDGDLNTTDDQTEGADWEFTVDGDTVNTDENGQVSVAVDQGTYDVTETVTPGYTLVGAVCEGAEDNGSQDGDTIFGVEVGSEDVVTCTFFNAPILECPEGQVGTYPDCSDPECPEGQVGTYPDCSDPECPEGQVGTYPDCAPPTTPTATISAIKIVCDAEEHLPNWGSGGAHITSTTVTDFLAADFAEDEDQNCHTEEWTFEWAPEETSNPGDNVGTGGGAWTSFTTTAMIPAGQKVWVREQVNSNYIPFSGATSDLESEVSRNSAELYCHTDVINYDNYDWIDPVVEGTTYHCVGFNVLVETPTDMCLNIDDIQIQVPDNMTRDENGNCNTPEEPKDVCANIEGVQTEVPEDMELQDENQCVTPEDNGGGGGSSSRSRSGGRVLGSSTDDTPEPQVLGVEFPGLPATGNGPLKTKTNSAGGILFAGLITLVALNIASIKAIKVQERNK